MVEIKDAIAFFEIKKPDFANHVIEKHGSCGDLVFKKAMDKVPRSLLKKGYDGKNSTVLVFSAGIPNNTFYFLFKDIKIISKIREQKIKSLYGD